jgi:hypothetical protein
MTETGSFRISQGLDVLPPKSGNAYPIPCEEWDVLKSRASRLANEPWLFQSLGSLLLGAALTTFVTILLGSFGRPEQQGACIVAWAVVAVALISGALCMVFANKERDVQRQRASDIVTQMELIEGRFDRESV